MNWKIVLGIVLVAIIAGGVGAYLYLDQQQPPVVVEEKDLVIAMNVEQRDMNNLGYAELRWNVYEALVKLERNKTGAGWVVLPYLAESWTISEGKIYEYKLREDVKFHDGTPFNATAVKYAYERMKKVGLPTAVVVWESIEVLDTYRVRITLKEPNYLAIGYDLGGHNIVSPTYCQAHAENVTTENPYGDWGKKWMFGHECGSGPYELVDWITGERIKLTKFENYWGGWKPGQNIKNIIVRQVKESNTQKMLIQNGEIQVALNVLSRDFADLNATGNVVVHTVDSVKMGHLALDMSEPPFNDVRVRRAMAYALDYDSMILVEPYLKRNYGGLNWGVYGANPDPAYIKYSQNITKAKELLIAAGYLDSAGAPIKTTPLKLMYLSGRSTHAKIAELVKISLAPLGFNVELQEVVVTLFFAYENDPSKYDMVITQGTEFYDFTGYMWNMLGHSTKATLNFAQYRSTEFDTLIDTVWTKPTLAGQLDLAYKAEKLCFTTDVADVAIFGDIWQMCIRTEVKGWTGFVISPVERELNVYYMHIETS